MAQALPISRTSDQPQEPKQPLLRSITLTNFLSFGPDSKPIELRPLNVLIGPNGSGKSNLIEAICFLRAAPKDLQEVTRTGGGVQEWVWKGDPDRIASVRGTFTNLGDLPPFRHIVGFRAKDQVFRLMAESIEKAESNDGTPDRSYNFALTSVRPVFKIGNDTVELGSDDFDFNASILSQRRDPERYPEITYLAEQYGKIRVYREWQFGRKTIVRSPQPADMRTDLLDEDFSNLGLFLNYLRTIPRAKRQMLAYLSDLYDGLDDFDVRVIGGTVQVFFTEGNYTIPATRLSDGTLRYLCLLAILCDPTPPPLICIEEPELGLHPDILPKIADLLVEASERTQLIVTTHSDMLVDALTDTPESILVCEKHDGQTQIQRLEAAKLAVWLKDYSLGQLWISGELGGKRW